MCLRNHVKITYIAQTAYLTFRNFKIFGQESWKRLEIQAALMPGYLYKIFSVYKEISVSVKYLQCFRIKGSYEGCALLTLKAIEHTHSSLNILYCIIVLAWPFRSIILAAYVSFSAVLIFESEHYSGYFDASFHIITMLFSHQNIAWKFTLELFAPKQANTLYFIYIYIYVVLYIHLFWENVYIVELVIKRRKRVNQMLIWKIRASCLGGMRFRPWRAALHNGRITRIKNSCQWIWLNSTQI